MYVKGVLPLPKTFFETFLAFVDAHCTTCLCAGAQQGLFSLSFISLLHLVTNIYFCLWNYLSLSIFLLLDFDEYPTCSTSSSSSMNPPPPFSINCFSTHGSTPLLLPLFGDLEILYFLLNPAPSSQVTCELSCPFDV